MHEVDKRLLSKEGSKQILLTRFRAACARSGNLAFAPAAYDLDAIAVFNAQLLHVGCVHVEQRFGKRSVERGHTPCHRASMPVFEQTTRAQHKWIIVVRNLGWRLPRTEHDRWTMISRLVEAVVFSQALVTVHLDTDLVVAFFLWAVREAPLRRQPLAINFTDRPGHAMVVDVLLVRSELFALHLELLLGINCSSTLVESRIAERAILLPDARAHLALGTELELASILVVPLAEQAVECVFAVDRFTVKHSLSDLHEHPEIPHGISRRINSLLENSRTTLTVAELTFTFDPHGSWQHYIRIFGRDRRVDLADNDERVKDTALVFGTAAKETGKVAHRLGPVVVRSPQEVDVAIRQLTEDLRRMETRSLDFIKIALGKIPNGL